MFVVTFNQNKDFSQVSGEILDPTSGLEVSEIQLNYKLITIKLLGFLNQRKFKVQCRILSDNVHAQPILALLI